MQVRSIEFQENFRLVTLEAARQQSVLIRDGQESVLAAAGTLAEQRAQGLERPNPTTETEAGRVVDEESRQPADRRNRERRTREEANPQNDGDRRGGSSIDLIA